MYNQIILPLYSPEITLILYSVCDAACNQRAVVECVWNVTREVKECELCSLHVAAVRSPQKLDDNLPHVRSAPKLTNNLPHALLY